MTQLLPLIDSIPPIKGKVGAPWYRPKLLFADRAYDSDPHRAKLRALSIKPVIARRNTAHGSGLGVFRYVVEQTIALLHQFRRLKIRYDKRPDIHDAFVRLGETIICWRRLPTSCGLI